MAISSNTVGKALIISISDYNDKENLPQLELCRNDGERMHSILKKLGYDIPDNFKLIGKVGYNEMRKAIISFF